MSGPQAWLCDSGTGGCRVFDGAGRSVGTWEVPIPQRTFSDGDLTEARDAALYNARDANARARVQAVYDPALRPTKAPRFASLLPGYAGEVWVEEFSESAKRPRRFLVLGSNGAQRGTVDVPRTVKIAEIGRDYVLGIITDDDGVERIAAFALRRP